MNILFELNHPAHFHLFKNAALKLQSRGYKIAFVVKQKDVLLDLVKEYASKINIFNRTNKNKASGFLNNIKWLIESDKKLFSFASGFKPDILLGTNFSFTHYAKLFNKPAILWNEDDAKVIIQGALISYPFTSYIISPVSCNSYLWEKKTIHYQGYHELSYLHPNTFFPDQSILTDSIDIKKPYSILRFSELSAHHDKGKSGITTGIAQHLIKILLGKGNVYITSERKLDPQFEKYRIGLDPSKIHHALYYADMYIGDSQTMAAEAAVLGTPSVRFNDFVGKLGYLEELEHKYQLTYGIKTSEPEKLYQKIEELLNTPNLKQKYQKRRQKMLADKIDVTAFMVWFIENYPESVKIMKENPSEIEKRFHGVNPDYQLRFK